MYRLDGCDAAAADALRESARGARRIGGHRPAAAQESARSYSVHVHTDDAGAAVEAGLAAGRLSRIVISALSSGATGLPAGGWTRERAVLAVVDGDGAAELFAGEGACVLQPDPDTGDPATDISAHQLVRAVVDTGAAQVMVLPNGYVAAEELVAGCTRPPAGASTWCRYRRGRWCRAWPRWPCTRPTGRQSTTATPWPAPPARPGTDRCASRPRAR